MGNRQERRGFRRSPWLPLLYLALAGLNYYLNGIVMVTCVPLLLAVGVLLRETGLLSFPGPRNHRGTTRRTRTSVIIVLAIGVGWPLLYYLDRATVNGGPLLAGPALRGTQAATSLTLGARVADPGNRFVVFDLEVASRLGAPDIRAFTHSFELEVEGRRVEPAFIRSSDASGRCDGSTVPRWGSTRCSLAFEVPLGAGAGRLHFKNFTGAAHSGDIDLRDLPQAPVPRVELRAELVAQAPDSYSRSLKTVELLIEAKPLDGAAPVTPDWLVLQSMEDTPYRAGSDRDEGTCRGQVVEQALTCHAVFTVPLDLDEGLLTVTTFDDVLPGAAPSAGVTPLRF